MFNKRFWKKASERAGKSAAQAVVGAIVVDGVLNVWTVDWKLGLGVAAGGALLSYLTSIITSGAGEEGTPDLVK
jgi:hypothetical protein